MVGFGWYVYEDGNSETIATYVDGEFSVPHSSHQRLFFAEDVGLTISNLTQEDFGEYFVRADIRSGSSFETQALYAFLRQPGNNAILHGLNNIVSSCKTEGLYFVILEYFIIIFGLSFHNFRG